jgi:hypothetical protein
MVWLSGSGACIPKRGSGPSTRFRHARRSFVRLGRRPEVLRGSIHYADLDVT